MRQLPGWGATLLFALSPLPQLVGRRLRKGRGERPGGHARLEIARASRWEQCTTWMVSRPRLPRAPAPEPHPCLGLCTYATLFHPTARTHTHTHTLTHSLMHAHTHSCTHARTPLQVRNLLEPQSLEGLSVGTMLLALLGNALMVPRALFVRDVVWLSGTCWACVAGWGQLFSMFRSASAATG